MTTPTESTINGLFSKDLPNLRMQFGYHESDNLVNNPVLQPNIDFSISSTPDLRLCISQPFFGNTETQRNRSIDRVDTRSFRRARTRFQPKWQSKPLLMNQSIPAFSIRFPSDQTSLLPGKGFFDLPVELRTKIYNYIFQDACISFRPYADGKDFCTVAFNLHVDCRRVCKTIYLETEDILFKNLAVEFGRPLHLNSVVEKLPPAFLHKIQSITIMADSGIDVANLSFVKKLPSLAKMTYVYVFNSRRPRYLLRGLPNTKNDLFAWFVRQTTLDESKVMPVDHQSYTALQKCFEEESRRFRIIYQVEIGVGKTGRVSRARRSEEENLGYVFLAEYEIGSDDAPQTRWLSADEYQRRNACFLECPTAHDPECCCRRYLPMHFEAKEDRLDFMRYNEAMALLQKTTITLPKSGLVS